VIRRANTTVVWIGILANVAIAAAKFIAAAFTGSAAMLAEGIHSSVDAADGSLLLVGERLSRRPPDDEHPLGYGREIFFWSFLVALIIFAAGGVVSIYRGINHLLHPEPLENVVWNYGVLGIAFVLDGISWVVTFRNFNNARPSHVSAWRFLHASKDPTVYTVLLEDTSDLMGLLIAFMGVLIGQLTGVALADGIASILIGCVLVAVSLILAVETRSLLLGEAASRTTIQGMCAIARADAAVAGVDRPLTVHVAPHQILLVLGIRFGEGLTLAEFEEAIRRIKAAIHEKYPDVTRIFIEPRR